MALEDLEGMLQGLGANIEGLQTPLAGLGTVLESLSAKSAAASASMGGLKDASAGVATSSQGASGAASGFGKAAEVMHAGAAKAAETIRALGADVMALATAPIPNAIGAMTMFGKAAGDGIASAGHAARQGLDALGDGLSKLGPEGAAAGAAVKAVGEAVEGVTIVFAAFVETISTVMGLTIEVAQKFDLMRDRIAALAGSAAGGAAVQAMIGRISAELPFATAQVNTWAQSLLAAGMKGKQLEDAIKGIAAAEALREGGGAALENMVKRLAEGGKGAQAMMKQIQEGGGRSNKMLERMGLNTHDLAKALGMTDAQFKKAHLSAEQMQEAIAKAAQAKGAPAMADLMNTFPSILQKAREGFLSLFSGVDVGPFMAAIKSLFGEFNKGSPAIKTLKPIIADVLGTLFKYATQAVQWLHKMMVAVGPVALAFYKFVTSAKGMELIKTTLVGLAVVVGLVAVPFIAAGAVVAIVVAGIVATVMNIVIGVGAVVRLVMSGASKIIAAFARIPAAFKAAGAAAKALGASIVAGLLGMDFGAFVAKMAGLAKAGLAAFKGVFGMKSPSKVMIEHGDKDIAGAAATGVDKGAPKLAKAQAKMAAGALPGKGEAGGAGSGGGSGRGETHYHYSGPVENYAAFRESMMRFMAEVEGEAGAQPEGA